MRERGDEGGRKAGGRDGRKRGGMEEGKDRGSERESERERERRRGGVGRQTGMTEIDGDGGGESDGAGRTFCSLFDYFHSIPRQKHTCHEAICPVLSTGAIKSAMFTIIKKKAGGKAGAGLVGVVRLTNLWPKSEHLARQVSVVA